MSDLRCQVVLLFTLVRPPMCPTCDLFAGRLAQRLRLLISISFDCLCLQVALAWLHAQGDDVFPLLPRPVGRFEEFAAALSIQLTQQARCHSCVSMGIHQPALWAAHCDVVTDGWAMIL